MLVSGASAKPKCRSHRRRFRIADRKRPIFASTTGGSRPARTLSKWAWASLSSPLMKNARAQLQPHPRTSSGRSTRIARNDSMASSRSASRSAAAFPF